MPRLKFDSGILMVGFGNIELNSARFDFDFIRFDSTFDGVGFRFAGIDFTFARIELTVARMQLAFAEIDLDFAGMKLVWCRNDPACVCLPAPPGPMTAATTRQNIPRPDTGLYLVFIAP